MKDFDAWNELKKTLASTESTAYCKVREVWWCSLGANIGYEQDGKHELFERPVLVVKVYNKSIFWGVPLSTKIKADNPHYLTLRHGKLNYSAITSQLRLLDTKRLQRKLYKITKEQQALVISRLKQELDTITRVKKSDSALAKSSEPEGIVSTSIVGKSQSVNRRNTISYEVNRQIWSRLNIFEQMGCIYPAIHQCLRAYHDQNDLLFVQSLEKAIDMFDATVQALITNKPHRIKEVLAAKNEFLRLFYLEHSPEEEASLERYFEQFALAANNGRQA